MTTSLWADFLNNEGRLIDKWTHYFPIYETHFSRFRNQSMLFLEIGSGDGGSAQMWKRYLGPFAQIVSLDIREACKAFEEDQLAVRIGDQSDTKFLAQVLGEFGPPDVVLDDGSHQMEHINASFTYLYPKVSPRGVYLVEDLHTAYWPEYGGGLKAPQSFVEVAKSLVDEVNGFHIRDRNVGAFARSLHSIHFYDSVIAFEKMPRTAPTSLRK